MASITQLADECGVSVATVSRALNGHPEVSADTRRRIQAAAARIGYRPTPSARALVRGRSDTVGLLWDTGYRPDGGRQHPFLRALLVAVTQTLGALGRQVLLLNADVPDPRRGGYLDVALRHQLDGVLMMGVDDKLPAVRSVYGSGLPCVALDLPIRGPQTAYITSDHHGGAVAAVRHLHALGHRKLATIAGPAASLPGAERLAGYQHAVRALGLPEVDEYVVTGDFRLESGYACGRRLAALRDRPTAVFAAGDEMAIGAMHAFADAGIAVPGDIAVVGFDGIETVGLVRPALTTIAQNAPALASAAVDTLLALADRARNSASPAAPAAPRTVPTSLVVRSSCGPHEPDEATSVC